MGIAQNNTKDVTNSTSLSTSVGQSKLNYTFALAYPAKLGVSATFDMRNSQINSSENLATSTPTELTIEPVGTGVAAVAEEDNTVYNTAGIEVKPDFPGGMDKFNAFIAKNYQAPEEEGLKGKVYVTFVVEKDGSLTDIKVLRDIGYGTGKEAIRVLNKCPKWSPGEQNGKKVRCTFSLPISIQSAE
jgi:protein TonB